MRIFTSHNTNYVSHNYNIILFSITRQTQILTVDSLKNSNESAGYFTIHIPSLSIRPTLTNAFHFPRIIFKHNHKTNR